MRAWMKLSLVVWMVAMLLVGATLMARHTLSLPTPKPDLALDMRLATMLTPEDSGRLVVIHTLYLSCRCSQRILEHLEETTRPSNAREVILLVGEGSLSLIARLRAKSFEVRSVTPEQLAAWYGIESAPLMIVINQAGEVAYSGGYTTTKQGLDVQDLSIIAQVQADQPTTALPVLGCAVSAELKASIDPLGVLQ